MGGGTITFRKTCVVFFLVSILVSLGGPLETSISTCQLHSKGLFSTVSETCLSQEFFADQEGNPRVLILVNASPDDAASAGQIADMVCQMVTKEAESTMMGKKLVILETVFDFEKWKIECESNLILIGSPEEHTIMEQLVQDEKSRVDWVTSPGQLEYLYNPYGSGCHILIVGGKDGDARKTATEKLISMDPDEYGQICADLCAGVQCDDECYDCDLWSQKCVDGDCVKDSIIEENSPVCGCGETFTITISIDKGCGATYYVGDMLEVNWEASHPCEITFWEVEPDGKRRKLNAQPVISSGRGSRAWTVGDYGYGRRAIVAEAFSLEGSDTDECEYYVLKDAANIQVTVKDQNGNPIPGALVFLEDSLVGTTDAAGTFIIPEVAFGEYIITVTVGDEKESKSIQIMSTQPQSVHFVFTLEGLITVIVKDQHGNPLQADVYIDGFKKGNTLQDGTFTTSASEGSHLVEARWQNETASQSVTVVRDQTSSVDLTVLIEVETTLAVTVQDTTGNAVSGANVYVDNILFGMTDITGESKLETTPGAHAVRIEKEGYQSVEKTITVTEGQNTETVTMTEESNIIPLIIIIIVVVISAVFPRSPEDGKKGKEEKATIFHTWLTEKKIAGFWVYPYVITVRNTHHVLLAIVKGLDTGEDQPPILGESVNAALFDTGKSLTLVNRPAAGPLPEVGGGSITANAHFQFTVSDQKLRTMAATIRGDTQYFDVRDTTTATDEKEPAKMLGWILGLFKKCCITVFEVPANRSGRQIKGFKLYESFNMNADFDDKNKCECSCCEFRQYIRGTFTFGGVAAIHQLPRGPLDPVKWREDGVPHYFSKGHHMFYGHRKNPEVPTDVYQPERKTGYTYRGWDSPMMSNPLPGVTMAMNLEFRGEIVDVVSGKVISSTTWTVNHTRP